MTAQIHSGIEARNELLEGIRLLERVVAPTLGPASRTVLIDGGAARPTISRSARRAAGAVGSYERFTDVGVRLAREIMDLDRRFGPTSAGYALVLTSSLAAAACRSAGAGLNPSGVRMGIDAGVRAATAALGRQARTVDGGMLTRLCEITTDGEEELGAILKEVFSGYGPETFVRICPDDSAVTRVKIHSGCRLPLHADGPTLDIIFEQPRVLILQAGDPAPLIEQAKVDGRALIIVSKTWPGRRPLWAPSVIWLRPAGETRGELLEDLAAVSGGAIVGRDGLGIEEVALDDLGTVTRAIAKADHAIFVPEPDAPSRRERLAFLRQKLRSAPEPVAADLRMSVERLVTRLAEIKVGGATTTERDERLEQVQAAVLTIETSIVSGVVPGGGAAFLRAARSIDAETVSDAAFRFGLDAVRHALAAPAERLLENAGHNGRYLAQRLAAGDLDLGIDVMAGHAVESADTAVFDPHAGAVAALKAAGALSALLVSSEVVIAKEPSL